MNYCKPHLPFLCQVSGCTLHSMPTEREAPVGPLAYLGLSGPERASQTPWYQGSQGEPSQAIREGLKIQVVFCFIKQMTLIIASPHKSILKMVEACSQILCLLCLPLNVLISCTLTCG